MSDFYDYSFLYLLTILFAILKITAVIFWPWWVVCLPTILAFVLMIIVLFIDNH